MSGGSNMHDLVSDPCWIFYDNMSIVLECSTPRFNALIYDRILKKKKCRIFVSRKATGCQSSCGQEYTESLSVHGFEDSRLRLQAVKGSLLDVCDL